MKTIRFTQKKNRSFKEQTHPKREAARWSAEAAPPQGWKNPQRKDMGTKWKFEAGKIEIKESLPSGYVKIAIENDHL